MLFPRRKDRLPKPYLGADLVKTYVNSSRAFISMLRCHLLYAAPAVALCMHADRVTPSGGMRASKGLRLGLTASRSACVVG